MKKEFSKFEISAIKRTAQNVEKFVSKKNKLKVLLVEHAEEYNKLQEMQEQWEAPIKNLTGGFTTEDLVKKVVKEVGVDKDGKAIKVTQYVLRYPDTVIPTTADVSNGESIISSEDVAHDHEPISDEEVFGIDTDSLVNEDDTIEE